MARKNFEQTEQKDKNTGLTKLQELICCYFSNKNNEKNLKKVIDEQNKQLKEILTDGDTYATEDGDYMYSYNGLVVKLHNTEKKSLNEEKLLEIAHKHKDLAPVIKTKEYIDMDVLEDMMYRGDISLAIKKEISKCEEIKVTPTLTVKEEKK